MSRRFRPAAPDVTAPTRPRLLLIGADGDLAALVAAWLPDWEVQLPAASGSALTPDLVVADLPCPSRADLDRLRTDLAAHGRLPILVLSSGVFGSVDCCGPAAQALGADGLLAKSGSGDALQRAVQRLTGG